MLFRSQLLKTDAKFYSIHVSPSEKELRAMGNTEQEQAEAMKRYIRKVFIPIYANNFNKELTASDIKFYGKIHFDRSRSDNELNMHCHLIVSRKDQTNKKKLSPLTNHKNTEAGIIKGGFDRVNLFQQVEQGFDNRSIPDRTKVVREQGEILLSCLQDCILGIYVSLSLSVFLSVLKEILLIFLFSRLTENRFS